MKVLSGAALFFLLICANLQAFNKAFDPPSDPASKAAASKAQPESWVISGFRNVAAEQEIEKKLWPCPIPGWPKSICAF